MTLIWVLMVFVTNDGEWREWNSFARESECLEVARVITHHREDSIQAMCVAKPVRGSQYHANTRGIDRIIKL